MWLKGIRVQNIKCFDTERQDVSIDIGGKNDNHIIQALESLTLACSELCQ